MAAACSLVKAAVSPLKFAQYVKIRPIFLSAAYICPFRRKYWEIVLGRVKFLKRYCYHKVCREVQIVSGKVCRKAERQDLKRKRKEGLLTHVVRHRCVRSGTGIPRIAAGRPLVGWWQGEIGRDHPLRVRSPVGQAVVGGQRVVRGRRDRRQRLALLQAAHDVSGKV